MATPTLPDSGSPNRLQAIPTAKSRATHRTVVLLRDEERIRLDTLASLEGVSAAEIIRRSLVSYEPQLDRAERLKDEEAIETALDIMMDALQKTIRSVQKTNETLDEIHYSLHPEKKKKKKKSAQSRNSTKKTKAAK